MRHRKSKQEDHKPMAVLMQQFPKIKHFSICLPLARLQCL